MAGEKVPYQNHARRHGAGGSDPVVLDTAVVFANAAVDAPVSVTTPWTYADILPLDAGTFEEDGSGTFALDASNQGVAATANTVVIVGADIMLNGVGAANHDVPPHVRLWIVAWTAGGTPSMANGIGTGGIANYWADSAPQDDEFSLGGWNVAVPGVGTAISAGQAWGIALEATGAAADWQVTSGGMYFIKIPVTV